MKTILFVCTGNTCRSPMAECMFNALLEKKGMTNMHAMSAGLNAMPDNPASEGAMRAMARRGLSLTDHRSKQLIERHIRDVSLVVGMSRAHADAVRTMFPNVKVDIRAFDPPIADPYCGSDALYEQAAQNIEAQLRAFLDEA